MFDEKDCKEVQGMYYDIVAYDTIVWWVIPTVRKIEHRRIILPGQHRLLLQHEIFKKLYS
jgi:hypothetical protein